MKKLSVFYNDQQNVKDNESFSPSAGKPALVTDLFSQYDKVEIVSNWIPLKKEEVYLAHDYSFVDATLGCKINNGFNNKLPSVAKSLLWTTGSFYRAAEYALKNKTVAMSPTSGFHHACWKSSGGFCTFNGLMIAAILLKTNYNINKIGIVDFDAHYGNGTEDIIQKLDIKYIEHLTFGGFADQIAGEFDHWLSILEHDLTERFKNCGILFYQAGADPHKEDPFGGYLSSEQMALRDKIVFKVAKNLDIPIVWNLAGGYQTPVEKVLDLHEATLIECLDAYFS